MNARWRPREGRTTYGQDLEPGMIIAVDHAGYRHKPWRLIEVQKRDDGRHGLIIRPLGEMNDFAQFNQAIALRKYASLPVLDEHYSVCVKCGELPPCSDTWSERIATASAENAARYEVEGVCPSCQEPVTRRQQSFRFTENLHVPLGPPVVFHARGKCFGGAVVYDEKLAKQAGTDPTLSCSGHHVHHMDDFYQCSNVTCPGRDKRHRSYSRCYVLREKCNRPECWVINERERN